MTTNTTNPTNKLAAIKTASNHIIATATNEKGSALKCIHQVTVLKQVTEPTFIAIEQRILTDQDIAGAYHLALLAQQTSDLPIDAKQLIDMVINKGDNTKRLALLKNLPMPPVDLIKQKILSSNDDKAIQLMEAYLQTNPDGGGSVHMTSTQQKEHIVPLSPSDNNQNA
ncbi:hypothetical protein VH441_02560 [Psychrobacter sp. HD31]|uniref:hypothetical protein n=1 Tax=Psychrobacter sp. HD31 TaxID=3112003 RepID=UPI003DA54D5C